MTLLDAKMPDLARERRNRRMITAAVITVLLGAFLAFWFRHWPQEHVVDTMFVAIEKGDYETAFGIWNADPDWKQHTDKFNKYTYGQFVNDWGPSGEYGRITQHDVSGSAVPRNTHGGKVTGLVVKVVVNQRAEPACLWVENEPHTIGFSPIPCS